MIVIIVQLFFSVILIINQFSILILFMVIINVSDIISYQINIADPFNTTY